MTPRLKGCRLVCCCHLLIPVVKVLPYSYMLTSRREVYCPSADEKQTYKKILKSANAVIANQEEVLALNPDKLG